MKRRVEKGETLTAAQDFYGARPATANVHPIAELSAENCTEQMGVAGPWYERLPHFRMGFTPSSGKELQSEYFVPRSNAVDAIAAVERLRDHVSPHLLITELRTIAGRRPVDEPVLQAAQPGDPLHLEAGLAVGAQGAADDRTGAGAIRGPSALGQALHHSVGAAPEALRDVRGVQAAGGEHDPHGKFRNAFLTANLYG